MLHVSVHIACERTLLRKHDALHGVLTAGDGHPIVVVDGRKYLGQTASQATMVEVLRNMEDCPGPVRKSGRVKANNTMVSIWQLYNALQKYGGATPATVGGLLGNMLHTLILCLHVGLAWVRRVPILLSIAFRVLIPRPLVPMHR